MLVRTIQQKIEKQLVPNKAVLVFGARRVGKTVMVRQILEQHSGRTMLLNGEDYDAKVLLEEKSIANYRRLLADVDLLAIDEAQAIPHIGEKLKLMVDEVPGIRILATGSSAFDIRNQVGEPLVGRGSSFILQPFSQQEISQQENLLQTRRNLETRLVFGSYPDVVLEDDREANVEYLKSIVSAYLLKDILSLDGIKNSGKMMELLQLVSFQVGSELSYDELSNKLGISKNTVQKYMDLLSKVYVIFRLGGYARNLRKEVSKIGKWYFYDNGIRNAVIGRFQPMALRDDVGALWENYFISERMKQNLHGQFNRNLYFWKTYDRQEIDLIEETPDGLSAFEIKWSEEKVKVPVAFAKNYPEAAFHLVNRKNYLDFI